MAILLASEINWSPAPRCCVCDVGITPYGRSQPFAVDVDQAGRVREVYCRRHGEQADATYAARFASYQEAVRARVGQYLEAGPGGPLTDEEVKAADAELRH